MNVLITREPEQSVSFINLLSKNRIYPFLVPLIEIIEIDSNLQDFSFDYIIFTSSNAFKYFYKFLHKFNLSKVKIVSIGEKTSSYIKSFNMNIDYSPDDYSAEGIIKLFEKLSLKNKKILIPGSCKRNNFLENKLTEMQNNISILNTYNTKTVYYEKDYVNNFIIENNINIITFFSPSAVLAFFEQANLECSPVKIVTIGKTTGESVSKYNKKAYHPDKYTVQETVKLIKEIMMKEA
jgi:uroporphyrinogen-III synthase